MPSKKPVNANLLQVLWLAVMVVLILLLFSFIPAIHLGTFEINKIDILSDLRPDIIIEKPIQPDSTLPAKVRKNKSTSTSPSMVTIQDYSRDGTALNQFIKALGNSSNQPVRIGFFGDSFIEGDIISSSLRDSLQKVFGGNGVGFVPFASETAGFRKSIKHTYANWTIYSILTPSSENIPLGISGYTYVPEEDNTVGYKPGKIPPQQNFKKVRLFYQSKDTTSMHYIVNDEVEAIRSIYPQEHLAQIVLNHTNIQSLQIRLTPKVSTYFFGISFEDNTGVYVDNFSVRRNSGLGLAKVSPELLKQFNELLDYKLIILQYGLNVASDTDSTNYHWYSSKMITLINSLKITFPNASFLLLSVSDRGVNKEGKIVTMDAIAKLQSAQKNIARKSGIAYWDLFEAMGGKNSIVKYTDANPPQAAKDYTHLTHLGGNKLGLKLASALLYEYKNHDR